MDYLKSISELLVKNDEQPYKFIVPSYQRGYRWDKNQVFDLLNDIYEFSYDKNEDNYYCLQPLIVKKINDKEYYLIDGQQRLTTIFLILKHLEIYIKDEKLIPFKISYKTRDSGEFLANLSSENCENLDYPNADIYYISKAYKHIEEWFSQNRSKIEMFGKFTDARNQIKFIWHEISEDEREVFSRINSGKIPLTNAELIKAIFINSLKDNELKSIELAKEWDEIEYYLQNKEVWGFLTKNKKYPTHIELIFEIYLNVKNNPKDNYSTYRKFAEKLKEINNGDLEKEISKIWLEIKNVFLTLKSWFEDYKLYHLIGFLISTGSDLASLYSDAKKSPKSKFKSELFSKMKLDLDGLDDLSYGKDSDSCEKLNLILNLDDLSYGKDSAKITKILLLFNIASILQNSSTYTRFAFDSFNNEKWSLEHINPQNEIEIKDLKKQTEWLDNVDQILDKNDEIKADIEEFKTTNKENDKKFVEIQTKILEKFNAKDGLDKDNISNLTLLPANLNSSLSNNIFLVKQNLIKNMDKNGEFIPLCTKNTFMKYYSKEAKNHMFWSDSDAQNYVEELKQTLENFLQKDKK